ncbi:DEAD/DEAH box helicase [Shewanella maritima]|uniref:DEAD/DEAH box helicase n=1 Tax=Shewanella maritima TaxID=2520507 RepID=UPI0037352D99
MSFGELALHSALLQRLSELEYLQPTQIQQQAIPAIMAGKDVLAGAQTGTGKTAAFALPLLHSLMQRNETKVSAEHTHTSESNQELIQEPSQKLDSAVEVLVLVPTRELAMQVAENFASYAQQTALRTVCVYGGVAINTQISALANGANIVIATPGRLLDLARKQALNLSHIKHLVLDEADRMLDMGFRDEIIDVLRRLPKKRQNLLFSATLDDRIHRFSQRLLSKPQVIEASARNQSAPSINERVFNVDANRKLSLLAHLMKAESWPQVLIFSRKKQDADKTAAFLVNKGTQAAPLHADLSQTQRQQVLAQFKTGELRALVATDVAARGIDISELPCVINMELPFQSADYVHRIGRTGRAGKTGEAITLLSVDDEPLLIKLEALLDRRLPQQWQTGFEPDLTQVAPVTRKTKKGSLKQQARQRALAMSAKKK